MDRHDWNQRYEGSEFVWSVEPNQFLVSEVEEMHPGTVLDLASGEGRNAVWLAEQGWGVTAVDFSRAGLDKARRLASKRGVNVDWVLADVTEYEAPGPVFDLVLICYLQVTAPDRRRVLEMARDAVRPGGVLLYIAHDLSNLERGSGGPRSPAVLSTPGEVVADLAGFRIEKAGVVERRVRAGSGHRGEAGALALDTLVRVVRPLD